MRDNDYGKKILISACLLGVRCRYDNKIKPSRKCLHLFAKRNVIPVCPEQLGGLSTPRCASAIETGRGEDVLDSKSIVVNERGEDVSRQFIKGAREVLKIAKLTGAKKIIVKSDSPSCGLGVTLKGRIENGKFFIEKVKGNGVAVSLLKRNGIQVISENTLR